MSKNLIPKIAQMLGVGVGEEFKIEGNERIYTFDLNGLHSEHCEMEAVALWAIVCGDMEIVKLPWKPKQDEVFYTFGIHATEDKWVVISCKWWNNVKNLSLYRVGWIYRSQAEAEAALPTVAKEMGVEYEL